MMASLAKPALQIRFSPQELQTISHQIRQDFAPCLNLAGVLSRSTIKLSPQALRDISAEISREFAPKHSMAEAKLVLLPVDPQHIHAYWTLTTPQMTTLSKATNNKALTLRIYSETPTIHATPQPATWFDVAIHAEPTQQTVRLPDTLTNTPSARLYATVINQANADNNITLHVQSNTLDYVGDRHATDLCEEFKSSSSSPHYSGKTGL
ncbi:MAG: DUF4912 domain-containing protein [Methylococcaceae bacterium]|nr:DUF4912 domain-containing protein [Methylococcaceae bacterium]